VENQHTVFERIERLEAKLKEVVDERNALRSDNEVLHLQVKQLKAKVSELEKAQQNQAKKNQQLTLDLDFNPPKNNEQLKHKLNAYIKELDECIALLSNQA
jgi:uncharacterized coiled-coil DUF342 family protein